MPAKKDDKKAAAVEEKSDRKPKSAGENRVDENTVVQTAEQRGDTPYEGVNPFPEGYVPDAGLHGNMDQGG